jgi:hypothetical protein
LDWSEIDEIDHFGYLIGRSTTRRRWWDDVRRFVNSDYVWYSMPSGWEVAAIASQ